MNALQKSYQGLSLVVEVNSDRILFLLAISGALLTGAHFAGF